METPYGDGRRDMAHEMIDYCQKQIAVINKHTKSDIVQINYTRKGLVKAYNNIIKRIEIKLSRMDVKCDK